MPSAPWTPPHTMCGNFLKDANVWDQLIKSKRKVITSRTQIAAKEIHATRKTKDRTTSRPRPYPSSSPTGKTGARNARPPKGSSSDSDEEQTETSPLLRKLARQKLVPGTGRSVQDINTDINRLVTGLIKNAFNVRFYYSVKELDGVSDEQLSLFNVDPKRHGPDIEDLRLDTTFRHSSALMRETPWNMCAEERFVRAIKDEVDQNPRRYGKIAISRIQKKVHDRFCEIYRGIEAATPAEGQTWDDVADQVHDRHSAYNARSRLIMARQHKLILRVKIASIMRETAETYHEEEHVERWSHALLTLNDLGYGGMSDEESDTEDVEHESGVVTRQSYRKVLTLRWRLPSLRDLLQEVDEAPREFPTIFTSLALKSRIKRVRVNQYSERDPPKKLKKALFDPEFLEKIGRAGMIHFKIVDDEDCEMLEIDPESDENFSMDGNGEDSDDGDDGGEDMHYDWS
ncbi:hypothetical protein GGF50DRAFT_121554 [Schizophyllum commune]